MPNELPKRKNTRLPDFNYSQAGYYFVTICTRERHCILGSVGAATCRPHDEAIISLTDFGKIAEQALCDVPNHYEDIHVDKYCIMPNHIHAVVVIGATGKNGRQIAAPTPPLSGIIGQMKRVSSMKAGISLWQKGYYDHIIRNEQDYLRIWQYIDDNPAKWAEDEYYSE